MLSQLPIKMGKISGKTLEMEILRAAIIAELDAINLYEQFAAATENKELKNVLLEVAREEKNTLRRIPSITPKNR